MDEIKRSLKQRDGAPKDAWSHLTEGPFPKPMDNKRSNLAQRRGAIAREEVDQQVRNFFR